MLVIVHILTKICVKAVSLVGNLFRRGLLQTRMRVVMGVCPFYVSAHPYQVLITPLRHSNGILNGSHLPILHYPVS